MYTQVMKVHQGTADSYMDELVNDQLDVQTHAQAISEITGNEEAVAPLANLGQGNEEDDDESIRDLVASFLLPEVERHRVREQIQQEERRYVDAAHKSIEDSVKDVEDKAE
jgi:hypothetical protein